MDTSLTDALVGRALDGRYQVRSRIARGGMATVYLALDTRLDREVALKVMHPHLADDPQFTARFIREARSAARLSHPNVVQVFDQGSDGDVLYLAMEYLRGRTLREVLHERGVLTPREALTVVEPMLDALGAAHRVGIVHRDIKPENVILTDEGRVKVADFGLARAASSSTSATGTLLGTVAYLAPELVTRGVADARTDVYAVGIMLFEMLTGRQPFRGDVPIQVAYQHVNDEVPLASTVVPRLPDALVELVATAAAKDPDARPADADDLLAEVRRVHAALSAGELDTRPDLPEGADRPGGSGDPELTAPLGATEVVGPLPARQDTRALPELTRGLAAPRDPAPAEPSPDDAALAALLRRRRSRGITALLVVLALAVALAVTAWYFAAGPESVRVVPPLVGVPVAQARATLDGSDLAVREEPVFSDTVLAGTVVASEPATGAQAHRNDTILVRVSAGPEFVLVPSLAGRSEADARAALAAEHLTAGATEQVFDDRPAGAVVSSSPAPGQRVHNGSAVTLKLSKGPEPVDVPDVVGQTREQAEAALAARRLKVSYGTPRNDDQVPQNSVLSQEPADGTALPGDTVTLVLSKGPVLVPVPNVVGKQVGVAEQILRAAGFEVERRNVLGGFFGTVRTQSPRGAAPARSTIVLTVV